MKIRSNALADLLRTTSCKVKNKVRICYNNLLDPKEQTVANVKKSLDLLQ